MVVFSMKLFVSHSAVGYVIATLNQGRREKFLAPGQKFRLGPLASGASKSRDEQKGQSVRRCSNFGPKSSDKQQKKGHTLRRCSNFGSTSSDEQNKVIASADVQISARNKKKHHRIRRP